MSDEDGAGEVEEGPPPQVDLFGNPLEAKRGKGYKGVKSRVMRTAGGMMHIEKETREREPHDHYPTPTNFILMEYLHLLPKGFTPKRILDPGAGSGPYGAVARYLWPEAFIVGAELDRHWPQHPAYNEWYVGDYTDPDLMPHKGFDLIVGNPPFKPAEKFLRQAAKQLGPNGLILWLLPLNFLASAGRQRELFPSLAPSKHFVCANRPSFLGEGETATDANEYSVFRWSLAHARRTAAETGGWWTMTEGFDWKLLWKQYLEREKGFEVQLSIKW